MNEIARYFDSRADDWEKTFNRPSAVQGAVAAIAGIGPAPVCSISVAARASWPTSISPSECRRWLRSTLRLA